MNSKLIAPCGMNCNLCVAFLRDERKCPGCKERKRNCIIRKCEKLKKSKQRFCSVKCKIFPCARLKRLDKRYRTNYDFSMIDNLNFIKDKGVSKFIKDQKKKYKTKEGIICIHNKKVYTLKLNNK
jgi:hypothetical protein